MDSALDSTNPQNPHKKHKMDGCVVWRIGVGKVGRTLLLAKAKSSKSFSHFVRDFGSLQNLRRLVD